MTPPKLLDQNGRPLAIERELAAGGEGTVFTLVGDANRVAKVYHRPPTPQTVEKLTVMAKLASPPLLALAAWPTEVVRDAKTKLVAGFLMPRLTDCQPIQHLYNPVQRMKFFPLAGWSFQVRSAHNLAAVFDEIHKTGCLVGDVNQSNAQVTPQALVRLIDCDSFQVRANNKDYLCEVGVEHYTPPELQGKSLRGLVRTENHDRFGLAVLLYQLLFVGRHPYAGVYKGAGDPSFEQLITEFRFAQGPAAASWGMAPPPHTPTFADIPPNVGSLFRRAFERGGETGTRPKAAEWLAALGELEKNTVVCSVDAGHQHWRGAKSCVWCRLAAKGGPEYYYGVAGGGGTFLVDEAKLREVIKRLEASKPTEFSYARVRFAPSDPVIGSPAPERMFRHVYGMTALCVATILCVLAMPFGLIRGMICLVGFAGAVVFGLLTFLVVKTSPWIAELRRRREAVDRTAEQLERTEDRWLRQADGHQHDHAELVRLIQKLIADCRQLAPQHQDESRRLTGSAEEAGRLRHLRLHLLSDADIPKIGAGRKQTLASHGLVTAADLSEEAILGIKGFGDSLTASLMAWRAEILKQFRFDPKSAVSPAEQLAVTVRFRNRQQQLLAEADRQITRLQTLAPECKAALKSLEPGLKQAVAAWMQARADLRLLTGRDE